MMTSKLILEKMSRQHGDTEKFKTHPSVLIIKDKIFQGNNFSFTDVSQSEVGKKNKEPKC